jgi:hypothetical protein
MFRQVDAPFYSCFRSLRVFCAARHPVLLTDYAGFGEFAFVMYAVRNTLPVIFEIAVVMVRAGSVADLAEAFRARLFLGKQAQCDSA